MSDEGLCCPVVVVAAASEEESSAHLWRTVVVLMAGYPHRMHLVAGTYRSSHQVVGCGQPDLSSVPAHLSTVTSNNSV